MVAVPPLTVGLPVYNGEKYLEQSVDAVLGQTFGDFELILCSNASTDGTDDICRRYEAEDERVRFIRQPHNIGAANNHMILIGEARAPLFKWASGDDLYARDLLEKCVAALRESPTAVLAHSWTAAIDGEDNLIQALEYPLDTENPSAARRLESMLYAGDEMPGAIRADDFYGVFRTEVLRRVRPHGSYFHADQTYMNQFALEGPFRIVPEWLYFRRHHPDRAHQANPTIRSWCSNLDPKRAEGFNPAARLVAEYVWDSLAVIGRSSLSPAEKRECYVVTARWAASRVTRRARGAHRDDFGSPVEPLARPPVDVAGVVPGMRGPR